MTLTVVASALERLTKALSFVALLGLIGIALFVFIDGILRWLFAVTFPGLLDVTQLLLPVIVSACFPAALLQRQHIVVRFVGSALGPRASRLLDAFGAAVLFVCIALIAWKLFGYAADTLVHGDVTWTLQLALAPSWFGAAALMALAALAQLMVVAQEIANALHADGR